MGSPDAVPQKTKGREQEAKDAMGARLKAKLELHKADRAAKQIVVADRMAATQARARRGSGWGSSSSSSSSSSTASRGQSMLNRAKRASVMTARLTAPTAEPRAGTHRRITAAEAASARRFGSAPSPAAAAAARIQIVPPRASDALGASGVRMTFGGASAAPPRPVLKRPAPDLPGPDVKRSRTSPPPAAPPPRTQAARPASIFLPRRPVKRP
jgi:hypothetical protein